MSDDVKVMSYARETAELYAPLIARELVIWKNMNSLPEDSHLRFVENILKPILGHNALRVAEALALEAILTHYVKLTEA